MRYRVAAATSRRTISDSTSVWERQQAWTALRFVGLPAKCKRSRILSRIAFIKSQRMPAHRLFCMPFDARRVFMRSFLTLWLLLALTVVIQAAVPVDLSRFHD